LFLVAQFNFTIFQANGKNELHKDLVVQILDQQ
jgi:hypothetical protein